MSEENVATLKRVYEAWGRGDFASNPDLYDPRVTLVIDPEIPDAGSYEGPEGIRSYMTSFLEAWNSLTIAASEIEAAGDRVLVRVRQTGVGKDSGVPVTFDYFQLWTLRDGKVVRLESIMREERAREALG
jgi:ketosteroid isomerase-like protein